MKKSVLILAIAVTLIILPIVKAETGTIRIETPEGEYWPIMLESPVTFEIWVQGTAANPTSDPHILLVMTEACYLGLTDNVAVTWTGGSASFSPGEFTPVTTNSDDVPPPDTYPIFTGASYTVASLKDHLSYGLSPPISSTETIFWAWKPFLNEALTIDHQSFTVTLPSAEPRMLVYALGKTNGSALFDNKVPPTRPGFMVPELGPILLVLACFSAFILYAVKSKRYP